MSTSFSDALSYKSFIQIIHPASHPAQPGQPCQPWMISEREEMPLGSNRSNNLCIYLVRACIRKRERKRKKEPPIPLPQSPNPKYLSTRSKPTATAAAWSGGARQCIDCFVQGGRQVSRQVRFRREQHETGIVGQLIIPSPPFCIMSRLGCWVKLSQII